MVRWHWGVAGGRNGADWYRFHRLMVRLGIHPVKGRITRCKKLLVDWDNAICISELLTCMAIGQKMHWQRGAGGGRTLTFEQNGKPWTVTYVKNHVTAIGNKKGSAFDPSENWVPQCLP